MRRGRRGVVRWVWYDLHGDLTWLHCHVVGNAGAELSQNRWGWSLAGQVPGLISLGNDNAGGHVPAHRYRTVGVIHDGAQGF